MKIIETEKFIIAFGGKGSSVDSFKKTYPNIQFATCNQVHGNNIVKINTAMDTAQTADGMYTEERQIGLSIKTADCMPIFIISDSEKKFAAIHAGWRGVANKIFIKALSLFVDPDLKIYIGPHIQYESFEVDVPVKNELISTVNEVEKTKFFTALSGSKYKVNLAKIIEFQARETNSKAKIVYLSDVDTMVDNSYHSYRRDKVKAGRQISFIALK